MYEDFHPQNVLGVENPQLFFLLLVRQNGPPHWSLFQSNNDPEINPVVNRIFGLLRLVIYCFVLRQLTIVYPISAACLWPAP
jgi:hypothetical protein